MNKEEKGIFNTVLQTVGNFIPGDYWKTTIYLNTIATTRSLLRKSINKFYRIDHIYDTIKQFKKECKGNFSILEFGVADGYSFTKKLYATRHLKMEDRIVVHGFDTFEGLPEAETEADGSLVVGEGWIEGHFKGRYESLMTYCRSKYNNFRLHKGLFEKTITSDFLESLTENLPILIWIDCDYYSSAKSIFDKLIPYIPSGCVIYFDDIYYNFSSRFTGEMKLVWEINQGKFGKGVELVLDPDLSLDSNRVYRFINIDQMNGYELVKHRYPKDPVRRRRDDSPFP